METKILLNVLVLYLPLPLFWALFDQQGSRWTFQATRMDGDLGFWDLKPDQMQVINPLLILVFIPLYEVLFYPLLNLVGVRRPLQKLTLGGVLAGVSFVTSAIVEIYLQRSYAVIPKDGQAQFRVFNGRNCDYTFTSNITDIPTFTVKSMEHFEEQYVKVNEKQPFMFTVQSASAECSQDVTYDRTFVLEEKLATSFFLNSLSGISTNQVRAVDFEENPEKSRNGWPIIRVLSNVAANSVVKMIDSKGNERFIGTRDSFDQESVPNDKFMVTINDEAILNDLELRIGGVYTLIISQVGTNFVTSLITITEANSMSMLWLIPQYVIMTLGEVRENVSLCNLIDCPTNESLAGHVLGHWSNIFLHSSPRKHEICLARMLAGKIKHQLLKTLDV